MLLPILTEAFEDYGKLKNKEAIDDVKKLRTALSKIKKDNDLMNGERCHNSYFEVVYNEALTATDRPEYKDT